MGQCYQKELKEKKEQVRKANLEIQKVSIIVCKLINWSSSFVHKSSYRLQLSLLETSVSGTLLRTSYVSTGQRM